MHRLLEITLSNAAVATVLALLVAAFCRSARRPALAHKLWLLVLVKLITPPLVTIPLPWLASVERLALPAGPSTQSQAPEPAERSQPPEGVFLVLPSSSLASEPADVAETAPETAVPVAWAEMLFGIWLASALLLLGWTAWQVRRFQRLLRHARPASPGLRQRVQQLARRLGIRSPPEVSLVPGVVSPMLWAPGRAPRLLFPSGLLERLDREQQDTLFLHELAHYRRRDHWVRYIELVVLTCYWWHPVVWWACRELREAEEQCCDAWVVWALAGASRAYATALVQTVAFFSEARCALPAAASGIGQARHLRRRLTMIMQGTTPRSLSWLGGLVVLSVGLFLLPQLSVQAQVGESKPKGDTKATDQAIEQLQKALEFIKRAQGQETSPNKSGDKEHAVELEKARVASEEAQREVEAKRRALHAAEERYNKALARLAELQGVPALRISTESGPSTYYYVTPDTKTGKAPVYYQYFTTETSTEDKAKGPSSGQGQAFGYSAGRETTTHPFFYYGHPANKADEVKVFRYPEAAKGAPAAGDRTSALEQKLEQLTREVENLRRELRRNAQRNPPGAPLQPK